MFNRPSVGFYRASELCTADDPTPSFFHLALRSESPHRVTDLEYLKSKYLVQWARDDVADLQPLDLDLVEGSPEEAAELGLYKTNEDQDGFQRAFTFDTGPALHWVGTTPFYATYLRHT